ncbi:MAG: hypothetical protein HJJLKODD_02708 [Phycisphaerae bacterium]|nr:hypothetical protein [Phycisphaerae bacterium]
MLPSLQRYSPLGIFSILFWVSIDPVHEAHGYPSHQPDELISCSDFQKPDQIVQSLQLTRQQAQMLVPLIESAIRQRRSDEEQEAELYPHILDADQRLIDQLQHGEADNTLINQVAQLHQRRLAIHKQSMHYLLNLEEKIQELLTSEQIIQLEAASRNDLKTPRTIPRALQQAEIKLQAIKRFIRQDLGPSGTWLFHPLSTGVIYAKAGRSPPDLYPLSRYCENQDKIRHLEQQICDLNLIDTLRLSTEQMAACLSIYQSYLAYSGPDEVFFLPRQNSDSIVEYERAIELILNKGQISLLIEYEPSVLPSPFAAESTAGRVDNTTFLQDWLRDARRWPDEGLDLFVTNLMDIEQHNQGPYLKQNYDERKALLLNEFKQIKAMSDVAFEISLGDLGKHIEPTNCKKQLQHEIFELSKEYGLPGPIAHQLLNISFMNQVCQRLQYRNQSSLLHDFKSSSTTNESSKLIQ